MARSAGTGSPRYGQHAAAQAVRERARRVGRNAAEAIDGIPEWIGSGVGSGCVDVNPFNIPPAAALPPNEPEGIEPVRRHIEQERRVRRAATAAEFAERHGVVRIADAASRADAEAV